MSETDILCAELREDFGSAVSRRLRNSGMVPCVVYAGKTESKAIKVESAALGKAISSPHIITLNIAGTEAKVLTQDVQWDYLNNTLQHVDFKEIRMDEKIHTTVPILLVGDCAGVAKGGNLDQVAFEIDIECLPTDIPEKIEVDITALEIGDSITIGAVEMPENVTALFSNEQQVLVQVAAGRVASGTAEEGDEEADAASAAE